MPMDIEKFSEVEQMIYRVIFDAASGGHAAPGNAEFILLTELTEAALQRRFKRLIEYGFIKANTRGGARAFYVCAIDKWTSVRGSKNNPGPEYIASIESIDTELDQCRAHTKQLADIKQRFEDVNVKPMRTIDCRGWSQEHSYGVVNYSALGWS